MKSFMFAGILILSLFSYGQSFRWGYTLFDGACGWLKFHSLALTWDEAHQICNKEGAVLVSPTNVNISKVLSGMMEERGVTTTPIFTGTRNKVSNSIQNSVEGTFESNTYTKTSEDCVGMYVNGTLADISCSEYHPFVCHLKKSAEVTECGTKDQEYVMNSRTGSCYKVYREQHTWTDASAICSADGGHLTVINSQAEAEVIWELAKDSGSDVALTIGFRSDIETTYGSYQRNWITVQGQTLEEAGYSRWFSGEPNSIYENCGSVIHRGSGTDGILNDVTCDMDLMFICEIEPSNMTKPETQTQMQEEDNQQNVTEEITTMESSSSWYDLIQKENESVACDVPECDTLDTEYVLNNQTGSCYKVHKDEHTWFDAYDVCASEGGHLAVINSEEEAEVIWDLATSSMPEYSIFIGYRSLGTREKRYWVTVQGQTLAEAGYEKWNWGEPNNPEEKCGGLNGSIEHGILNDVGCEVSLTFICEIKPRASTYMKSRDLNNI